MNHNELWKTLFHERRRRPYPLRKKCSKEMSKEALEGKSIEIFDFYFKKEVYQEKFIKA
jgi:hypothetical protein